jgi:hypothetical protein
VSPTDSAAAIKEAARCYFLGLMDSETEPSSYSTGPLEQLNRLSAATTFGTSTCDVSIERLEVSRIDGDTAEAALDARQILVIESEHGSQKVDAHFTGPLRLRHVDGEWRVADYVMNGDSMADSFFPLEAATNGAQAVAVRPRGLFRNRKTVILYLEVENQTAHAVELSWAAFKYCFAPFSRAEVLPGETVLVRTGWNKRLAPWNRKLQFFLRARARSASERHAFDISVNLGSSRSPVRRRRWMPVSVSLAHLATRAAVRIPVFATVAALAAAIGNYHGVVAFGCFLGAALLSDEIVVKLDRRWWKPAVLLRIGFDLFGILAIVALVVLR